MGDLCPIATTSGGIITITSTSKRSSMKLIKCIPSMIRPSTIVTVTRIFLSGELHRRWKRSVQTSVIGGLAGLRRVRSSNV